MNRFATWLRHLSAAPIALLVFAAPLVAQNNDPFAEGGGKAPAKNGAASKAEPKSPSLNERDPIVLTIQESNPKSPDELMRAVVTLLDIDRLDVAKRYLGQLVAGKLDEATLAGLQQKFGSDQFFRLFNSETLAPQGRDFARAVLAAASKVTRDPNRLTDRVVKLTDPNIDTRLKALDDLRSAGDAAVAPLVRALVDDARQDEHAAVKKALASLGDSVIEPLIGALEAPQDSLRASVFDVLAALRADRALPYLMRPALDTQANPALREAAQRALQRLNGGVPSVYNATHYLARRVRLLLDGAPVVRLDREQNAYLWHWDAKLKMVVSKRYAEDAVSAVEAARVARELYAIAPDNVDFRRLFLTAQLEASKLITGMDRPLPRGANTAFDTALKLGPDVIEDLIPFAQSVNRLPALVSALEVFSAVGKPEMLASLDGSPRPAARMLGHADRRVRFAAMDAILKIDPREPFPGASRVTESLGFFAAATGTRRVLVAWPQLDEAQTFVGMLAELGYSADAATTGRAAFQLAAKQPDYEFAIIGEFLDSPRVGEFLQMLRQEPRTASLPVGVLMRPEKVEQERAYYEADRLVTAYAQPRSTEGLDSVVDRLMERATRRMVGRDERVRQAALSLDWLAKLAEVENRYSFLEIRAVEPAVEAALGTPELAARAAKVLGLFGTPRGQQSLVDFASQNTRPLADREAAAAAFRTAVSRRGLSLLRNSVLAQYDRYNQSQSLDQGTQTLLGSILDTIEKKGDEPKKAGD